MKPKLCWTTVILGTNGVSWSAALIVTSSTVSSFCCSCVCSAPLVSQLLYFIWNIHVPYIKAENKVKIILQFGFILFYLFRSISNKTYYQTTVNFFENNVMHCRQMCLCLSLCLLLSASGIWLSNFEDSTVVLFIPFESLEWYNPYFQAFVVFFTYIIIFQVICVLLPIIEIWT